ncbi:copper amine oxidase N-terminal domain-containing protein [Paenibacillus sonchi]|uniref:copper amine oxidase N-terminal domain-containing protein n=1 Tax=Paenibacillus sonchi TaxID=373687 RepID=UPI001E432D74|nr:copper amine oxidase N-terminal domain-containing protein [Paenibacillus sonchi]
MSQERAATVNANSQNKGVSKRMKKKTGLFLMSAAMLLGTVAGTAAAAKVDVSVQVNSKAVKFPDAKPYYEDNRVLIPIRFVSEALGAEVGYGTDRVVTIKQGAKTVVMKINSKTVTVDSVVKELDVPARLEQNRTYVPLRFISEALGAQVGWNQQQHLVTITTGSAATAIPTASATPTATPTANSNNMYKVGFEWPREKELGKELFINNMKVEGGKLTFTLPKDASGSKDADDGSFVKLIPGRTYSYPIGKDAGSLSISKPESKGDQWEGYTIMLDTNINEDLSDLFGSITNDVIVVGANHSGSPLTSVIQKAKDLN